MKYIIMLNDINLLFTIIVFYCENISYFIFCIAFCETIVAIETSHSIDKNRFLSLISFTWKKIRKKVRLKNIK